MAETSDRRPPADLGEAVRYFSDVEVANALGIAVGTVKAHINRGMTGLRHGMTLLPGNL